VLFGDLAGLTERVGLVTEGLVLSQQLTAVIASSSMSSSLGRCSSGQGSAASVRMLRQSLTAQAFGTGGHVSTTRSVPVPYRTTPEEETEEDPQQPLEAESRHWARWSAGGAASDVGDDVDHVPVLVTEEEPAHTPSLVGERMDDVESLGSDPFVHGVDVSC